MQIGKWDVQCFVAGKFRLDGGAMFGVVPKVLWSKSNPADDKNRIAMVMRSLLVRGYGKTVIVDTGCGLGYGDKISRIYAFEDIAPIAEHLGRFELTPEDITDVVATHLHFDHFGGIANQEGERWHLTFPTAVHHVQKAQWGHALSPNARDRASYFRQRIEIMDREGTLSLHDGEWSLAPGFDLLPFHGHTPGQQLPRIAADDKSLFFCGDLIPLASHLPTPFIMAYDLEPVVSMKEKLAILDVAAAEQWILAFEHDPEIEACYPLSENGRYVAGETLKL
jgi:glyoxylase-like metal-dependent hydrolase (beta-lactamase superfamily II)